MGIRVDGMTVKNYLIKFVVSLPVKGKTVDEAYSNAWVTMKKKSLLNYSFHGIKEVNK